MRDQTMRCQIQALIGLDAEPIDPRQVRVRCGAVWSRAMHDNATVWTDPDSTDRLLASRDVCGGLFYI